MNQDITVELAQEALKDIMPNSKPKSVTIQDIQKVVGEHYNIRLEDFSSKKRTKSIAFPRQVAMYLSRELTDFSLPKIGEEFGAITGRNETNSKLAWKIRLWITYFFFNRDIHKVSTCGYVVFYR